MAKQVTIQLIGEPIKSHSGPVTAVTLREPRYSEYSELGEPARWAVKDGVSIRIENDDAIKGYIERCVVAPADSLLLDQAELVDAMRIKEGMLGFFWEARAKISSNSSSSSS
ncbi:hypothetical protein GJ654_18805 [Rhodoblastus acidophilus]|uniref:Phage tail assembly chaperone protein, E, or 41 or 14 n=1 Tax=Rhodoblastus acidophilus TaxID=1074 RepID=A0A6N8DVZ1_RHOAC|nr:hypothetical protein [Rhodoblastus acidophilus]MCW2276379.1 hypothetical protein [Rhodoblastus acidophilus]MTV33034.1 hypothetical protein [Rhodoblastus acidophilus]